MTMQADELREIRATIGCTQAAFAQALGVSATFIGLMERGEKEIASRTAGQARGLASAWRNLQRAVQQREEAEALLRDIAAGWRYQEGRGNGPMKDVTDTRKERAQRALAESHALEADMALVLGPAGPQSHDRRRT